MSDEAELVYVPISRELYIVLQESAKQMGLEIGELLQSALCYSIAEFIRDSKDST